MESLPPEIQLNIFQYFEITDLKSIRATCKSFRCVTPLVFETFYMGMTFADLERLQAVSDHPEISLYVKDFMFDTLVIPNIPDPMVWQAMIEFRIPFEEFLDEYYAQYIAAGPDATIPSGGINYAAKREYDRLPRHSLTRSQLQAGYAAHNAVRYEQYAWSEPEDKIFANAFSKLKKLVSVTNCKREWSSLRQKIILSPDQLRCASFDVEHDSYAHPIKNKFTMCIIQALGLRYEYDYHDPETLDAQQGIIFMELGIILDASKDLESLSLVLKSAVSETARIVRSEPIYYTHVNMFYELKDLKFPSLTTVQLNCRVTEDQLTTFMFESAPALRSVSLVHCILEEGTWDGVIGPIPGRMRSLERIELVDLIDESISRVGAPYRLFVEGLDQDTAHGAAVTAWILHGTEFEGGMPPLDAEEFDIRTGVLEDCDFLGPLYVLPDEARDYDDDDYDDDDEDEDIPGDGEPEEDEDQGHDEEEDQGTNSARS
ncbi:hypothetical protein MBLNU459_g4810t1 [Dothideomycetes sp. NU459]